MKRLADTKEAARILGVSERTIQRWFGDGKIEGQFVNTGKGYGKAGQVLKVWIDENGGASGTLLPAGKPTSSPQIVAPPADLKRYKVHRGEPGCRVITPLINGEPIINIEAYLKPSGDRGGDLVSVGQLAVPGDRESPQLINNGTIPILQAPSGRSVNGDSLQILLERNDQPPESLDSGLPAVKKSTREKTAILPSASPPSPCEVSIPPSQGPFFLSSNPTGCRERLGISDSTNRANRVCDPLPPEREERRECVASTGLTPDHIKTGQYPEDPAGQCAQATGGINLPVTIRQQKSTISPSLKETAYLRLAILNTIREEIAKNHKPRAQIIKKILELYNSGLILPNIYNDIGRISRSTLYAWDSAERSGGIKALIPCYRGARGSGITDQEKYILLNALLHQNRLKIGTAIKFTKTFLEYKKIPSPSGESKLRRFVDEFKRTRYDVWVEAREGAKALNDKCSFYAERDWRLLTVGEGLVADGHRLNFQVINPFNGKRCRATIVLFWDWKSAYPLGWEIMIEENIQCIASALRNAILTLGKVPKWLLIDNGKAFKAKCFTSEVEFKDGILYGMFATLGIHTHFAQAYNPQEKPLERFWGTFNNWFERLLPSYTGASIGDKPAYTMRNEKDAQARHNKWIPKIEEVSELLFRWREFYAEQPSRGRDNQTPREIFEKEKGPGVDPNELAYLMMTKEIKSVGRNGVTWNGWHYYNDALYGFRDKVIVRYSHTDYSELYIFSLKNEFLCVAKPIEKVHPMASEADAPADRESLKRTIATKRRLRRQTLELHEMLEEKAADALPWKKIINKDPNVIEAIEKKEAEKPRAKTASAFVEEEINAKCEARYAESANRDKNAAVIDLRTGLSRPADGTVHENQWEKYDWYMAVKKENPKALNAVDHAWISEYEATEEWKRIYGKKQAIGGER